MLGLNSTAMSHVVLQNNRTYVSSSNLAAVNDGVGGGRDASALFVTQHAAPSLCLAVIR